MACSAGLKMRPSNGCTRNRRNASESMYTPVWGSGGPAPSAKLMYASTKAASPSNDCCCSFHSM